MAVLSQTKLRAEYYKRVVGESISAPHLRNRNKTKQTRMVLVDKTQQSTSVLS
jgi:hypothetical protein